MTAGYPSVRPSTSRVVGTWSVLVDGVNRTFVRGIPVKIDSISTTDPFGPASASLTLPQVTMFEPLGVDGTDLAFLRPDRPVEIQFKSNISVSNVKVPSVFSWKGYTAGFGWSKDGLTVECVGALRALDYAIATEETNAQPWPIELAIERAINRAIIVIAPPNLRLMAPPGEAFNTDWWAETGRVFHSEEYLKRNGGASLANVMRPLGLVEGQNWSGMVTRTMGGNDKVISSYVSNLLQMMYTERGRFSIRLRGNTWQPELFHVYMDTFAEPSQMLHINAMTPGVDINLNIDYGQTVTDVFGEVNSSLSGTSYKGEAWLTSGAWTYIEPFAQARLNSGRMRRHQHIQFLDGLTVDQAKMTAREHVNRNSEPGLNGSIRIASVDPRVWDTVAPDGQAGGQLVPFPKQLITAGMSITVDGLFGKTSGERLFITEVSHDVEENAVTLTVDGKWRDFKSSNEIAIRGRDALAPVHMMTVGSYSEKIEDRLSQWNPEKSGYAPFRSTKIWNRWRSKHVFEPTWPWVDLTREFPPRLYPTAYDWVPRLRNDYLMNDEGPRPSPPWYGLEGADLRGKPDYICDWVGDFWTKGSSPYSVRLPPGYIQVGDNGPNDYYGGGFDQNDLIGAVVMGLGSVTISSVRAMCVDVDGNPLPVTFFLSLFNTPDSSIASFPVLPGAYPDFYTDPVRKHLFPGFVDTKDRYYAAGEPYPFFPYAFQSGSFPGGGAAPGGDGGAYTPDTTMVRAWGSYWDRPGFWPASSATDPNAQPTGLFADDTNFVVSKTEIAQSIDPTMPSEDVELLLQESLRWSVQIYCDELPEVDKYFLVRFYKENPSS